jgi:hypothetical protein
MVPDEVARGAPSRERHVARLVSQGSQDPSGRGGHGTSVDLIRISFSGRRVRRAGARRGRRAERSVGPRGFQRAGRQAGRRHRGEMMGTTRITPFIVHSTAQIYIDTKSSPAQVSPDSLTQEPSCFRTTDSPILRLHVNTGTTYCNHACNTLSSRQTVDRWRKNRFGRGRCGFGHRILRHNLTDDHCRFRVEVTRRTGRLADDRAQAMVVSIRGQGCLLGGCYSPQVRRSQVFALR